MTKDTKQLKKSLKKLQELIKENSKSKSYVEDLFEMRQSEEIPKCSGGFFTSEGYKEYRSQQEKVHKKMSEIGFMFGGKEISKKENEND